MDVRNKQQNIGFGILNIRADNRKKNLSVIEAVIKDYTTIETRSPHEKGFSDDKIVTKIGIINRNKIIVGNAPNERHLIKSIWRDITDHTAELKLAAHLRKLGATVKRTLDPMLAEQHYREDLKWLSKPTKR